MRLRLRTACLAAVTACALVGATAAIAAAGAHEPPSGRLVVAAAAMTLDQAVAAAERRYQARVVRTEVRDEGGRTVYVLRLLSDSGRVWVVKVDAASGEMR